jgi:hypothetical protein
MPPKIACRLRPRYEGRSRPDHTVASNLTNTIATKIAFKSASTHNPLAACTLLYNVNCWGTLPAS